MMRYKTKTDVTHLIRLTPAQHKIVQWALDAVADFAGHEDAGYLRCEVPFIIGRTLHFTPGGAFDDLVDRLTNHAPDLIADDADTPLRIRGVKIGALERFVEKLKARARGDL